MNNNFQAVRSGVITLVYLMWATLTVWADQKLPMLNDGTKIYSNVTVTAVTATDIFFKYDKGVANAKLKNLDPELQKRFNYDPARAAAAETATSPSGSTVPEQNIDAKNAKAVMDDAVARVKAIVNQPVRQLASSPDLQVSSYSPGWFHEGATKPDFKNVDVRTSQDTQYGRHPYVTSDLNPGVVFVGSEVEFNPMTKYFYENLSLPKKKLTEAEMVEINRLYRIIGTCEEKLQPSSRLAIGSISGSISTHRNALAAAAGSLVVLLVVIRVLSGRRSE